MESKTLDPAGLGPRGGLMSCEPGLSPSWGHKGSFLSLGGDGGAGDSQTRQHPMACGTRTQNAHGFCLGTLSL
jgi:hypothetical protein